MFDAVFTNQSHPKPCLNMSSFMKVNVCDEKKKRGGGEIRKLGVFVPFYPRMMCFSLALNQLMF
jgi:ribosomal protein S16